MSKRRRGPQPLPQEEKRTIRVVMKLTAAEYELAKIKSAGLNLAKYARAALLQAKPAPPPPVIPTTNVAAWQSSAALQNNLNQLVRRLHSQGIEAGDIEELAALVAQLRAALVGVKS
ncbi:TPA: plasmid mobilization relaxosome protein MobC [Pseudomonas aeruginosa]|nr:plasmid mobilization relaxosome protein MobC [Pseudomonas aeruginosa]